MIVSFADPLTKRLYDGRIVPRYSGIAVSAYRKLLLLDAAVTLDDLVRRRATDWKN